MATAVTGAADNKQEEGVPPVAGEQSLYHAAVAELVATLLFVYVTVGTVIGHKRQLQDVGALGVAWSFGGTIFVLVYISGGHLNPAITFGRLLARQVSPVKAALFVAAQCVGAVCGAALVRAVHGSHDYDRYGGGANVLSAGYSKAAGFAAEAAGTFVLVCTVLATDGPGSNQQLGPLAIGFAVFVVHLATIPITGTGINPARSLGPAVVVHHRAVWKDQWIFWAGPLVGAAIAVWKDQWRFRGAFAARAFDSRARRAGP
ncbi:hypothetical protein EJB05_00230, partial [Eragrostis curvula]